MKKQYMWGCRVTFKGGGETWAWETGIATLSFCPRAFTRKRNQIMPLVRDWRASYNISKAVAVRVCLDDLLEKK